MDKAAFLARVRDAAHAGRAFRVTPADELATPLDAGRVDDRGDLPARLAAEIDAVGGRAHLANDWTDAHRQFAELLDHYRPQTALCWQHRALDAVRLNELLGERSVPRLDYEGLHRLDAAEARRQILTADIGISGVSAAVAETGSLVLVSGPGRERLASLAPPVHVAVVAADQIIADLFDLFPGADLGGHLPDDEGRAGKSHRSEHPVRLDPAAMPSNLVLVTGPSKTGDLELKLTTGVHGPGEWHVIIVRAALGVNDASPASE